jgi:peptidoglycan/xylan/chitin deacetylase (PgdA/CDA1 family)
MHTLTHPDLTKLPENLLRTEAFSALDEAAAHGIYPLTFAHPYGAENSSVNNILFSKYKILRGFGSRYRSYPPQKFGTEAVSVTGISIDKITLKSETLFQSSLETMLRSSAFLGNILPLGTHDIAENVDWGISPARLEWLLERINHYHLPFLLYKDFSS